MLHMLGHFSIISVLSFFQSDFICYYSLFDFLICPSWSYACVLLGKRCMKTIFLERKIGGNFIQFFAQNNSLSYLFLFSCSQTSYMSNYGAAKKRLFFLLFIIKLQSPQANNTPRKDLCQKQNIFYLFDKVDIIQVIRQMQDLRTEQIGKSILRSLAQITRNRKIHGYLSQLTDSNTDKSSSKYQKSQRKQSCNVFDYVKLGKNYSSSNNKSTKGHSQKEILYIYDIPVPSKYKRKASLKQSRKSIQKSFNYTQIKSCLDINDHIPTAVSAKSKKVNSISSTYCSGQSVAKYGRKNSKNGLFGDLLERSSLLLEEYQTKCRQLQKENGQIRQRYDILVKKLKKLSKNRTNDLIKNF